MATVVGITLGVLSARKPGGLADRFALAIAYLGISFPVYWVGLLLILLVRRHAAMAAARRAMAGLRFLILPALTLGHAVDRVPRPHDPLARCSTR